MQDPAELNAKLLERALEYHDSARANFVRDLKIAAAALLVFQFFVFFRFTSLSDQLLDLQPKLSRAAADERALAEVQGSLDAFKDKLASGTKNLTDVLKSIPQDIRGELAELDAELGALRGREDPGLPRPMQRMNVQNSVAQSNQAAFASRDSLGRLLMNVTPGEQRTLREAKDNDPAYQQAVARIVEAQIIQSVFRRLNQQVNSLLTAPLTTALGELRQRTAALTTLRKTGANVDAWLSSAETVVALAAQLKFEPPPQSDWWTRAASKDAFADAAQLNTRKIADEAKAKLSQQDAELASLTRKLETTLHDLQQQETKLDAESKRLQANADTIKDLMEGYAKPLAAISLRPKDLVLFYPVVLAAVVTMFAVRQLLLRRRSAALATAYRELGISNETLALCFPDVAPTPAGESTPVRSLWSRSRDRMGSLLWVVAVGLAVTSFGWILASKSLGAEAPRLLYLCSGAVLIGACLFLKFFSADSKRRIELAEAA
jgi:hypothetical protein